MNTPRSVIERQYNPTYNFLDYGNYEKSFFA